MTEEGVNDEDDNPLSLTAWTWVHNSEGCEKDWDDKMSSVRKHVPVVLAALKVPGVILGPDAAALSTIFAAVSSK